MKHSLLLFSILVLTLISCAQKNLYNVEGYDEVKRGEIEVDGARITNTVLLQNRNDSNHTAKLTFKGSLYRTPITRFFYYKNIANGPFEANVDGRLFRKGYYKNGKKHGEIITYSAHYIRSKEHGREGAKAGTWEAYDEKGKLIRRKVFDNNGKIREL